MRVEKSGVKQRGWLTKEEDGNFSLLSSGLLQRATGTDDDVK